VRSLEAMSKKPRETLWELEDHSRAKHAILRRYLGGWLPVMSKWNKRLVLVDGFAGPGRYTGGEDGSPLIMLKSFLEHDRRDLIDAELVYVFIDEDDRRIEHLEGEIAALGKLADQVKLDVVSGNFTDVFREELEDLSERGARLAPTFAFIDPFGYKDSPIDLTGSILQFDRCEVLVYVPMPHINRFISDEGPADAITALFGTDRYVEALDLEGEDRRAFLHDLFRDQLKQEGGVKYVRSFEIVTKSGGGYHLFFGTDHEKGLELMKEAMWKIDPIAGSQYRDSTRSDQLVLLEPEPDTEPLLDALRDHFGDRPFTIEDAEHFALVETPYLPKHLREPILKPLEKADQLEVVSSPRKRRWTYPGGTIMRFDGA
jgi:three-Cys-motif partner protein